MQQPFKFFITPLLADLVEPRLPLAKVNFHKWHYNMGTSKSYSNDFEADLTMKVKNLNRTLKYKYCATYGTMSVNAEDGSRVFV